MYHQWIQLESGFPVFLFQIFCLTILQIQKCQTTLNSNEAIPDICEHENIDSAAHLIFEDGIEKYFISNGHYYWLLNTTTDIPDEHSAMRIPFDFEPDVALIKDTTKCGSNGHRSLLLIQMKTIPYSDEAEWFTLEMKIGHWNSSGAIFWNDINKIAHCHLTQEICTTADSYFTTMSFDFKKKLDSAFGIIGDAAYFIQGETAYKVVYKSQCIKNPYRDVIAYPGIPIGTTTTGALIENYNNNNNQHQRQQEDVQQIELKHRKNISIILFDRDVHYRMNISFNDNDDNNVGSGDASFKFDQNKLMEPANWLANNNEFFTKCTNPTGINMMFQDIFSGSKRNYYLRRATIISLVAIIVILILLTILVYMSGNNNGLVKRRRRRRSDHQNGVTTTNNHHLDIDPDLEERISKKPDMTTTTNGATNGTTNGSTNGGTFLQTNC